MSQSLQYHVTTTLSPHFNDESVTPVPVLAGRGGTNTTTCWEGWYLYNNLLGRVVPIQQLAGRGGTNTTTCWEGWYQHNNLLGRVVQIQQLARRGGTNTTTCWEGWYQYNNLLGGVVPIQQLTGRGGTNTTTCWEGCTNTTCWEGWYQYNNLLGGVVPIRQTRQPIWHHPSHYLLGDLQAVETILQDKTDIKQMVSYLVYNRACLRVLARRLSSAFCVVILGA